MNKLHFVAAAIVSASSLAGLASAGAAHATCSDQGAAYACVDEETSHGYILAGAGSDAGRVGVYDYSPVASGWTVETPVLFVNQYESDRGDRSTYAAVPFVTYTETNSAAGCTRQADVGSGSLEVVCLDGTAVPAIPLPRI